MIDVESIYATAGDDDARVPINLDEVMNAANYRRNVPPGTVCVKRARAASLGSTVFHNRVILYYERKGLGLPALERLGPPDAGAIAESLESHLVSGDEALSDSFVGGTIVCLGEPCHIDITDDHSPIVVAIGSAETRSRSGLS